MLFGIFLFYVVMRYNIIVTISKGGGKWQLLNSTTSVPVSLMHMNPILIGSCGKRKIFMEMRLLSCYNVFEQNLRQKIV